MCNTHVMHFQPAPHAARPALLSGWQRRSKARQPEPDESAAPRRARAFSLLLLMRCKMRRSNVEHAGAPCARASFPPAPLQRPRSLDTPTTPGSALHVSALRLAAPPAARRPLRRGRRRRPGPVHRVHAPRLRPPRLWPLAALLPARKPHRGAAAGEAGSTSHAVSPFGLDRWSVLSSSSPAQGSKRMCN